MCPGVVILNCNLLFHIPLNLDKEHELAGSIYEILAVICPLVVHVHYKDANPNFFAKEFSFELKAVISSSSFIPLATFFIFRGFL